MTNQRLWLLVRARRFEGEARESLVVRRDVGLHAPDSIVEACSLGIRQPSYIKSGVAFGGGHDDVRNVETERLSDVYDYISEDRQVSCGEDKVGQ